MYMTSDLMCINYKIGSSKFKKQQKIYGPVPAVQRDINLITFRAWLWKKVKKSKFSLLLLFFVIIVGMKTFIFYIHCNDSSRQHSGWIRPNLNLPPPHERLLRKRLLQWYSQIPAY